MNSLTSIKTVVSRTFFFFLAMAFSASLLQAGTIPYGDMEGTDVYFLSISEAPSTFPQPLFGQPHPVGNSLAFMPLGFSSSSLKNPGGSDIVDGNLNFEIKAKNGKGIKKVTISEAGDFTLIGPPGAYAFAAVSTPVTVNIYEVDHVALAAVITKQLVLTFTPDNGQYLLQTQGTTVGALWNGGLVIDCDDILESEQIDGTPTFIEFNLDNVLATTQGADGGAAFIAKKAFDVTVNTRDTIPVPEPSSAWLAAICMLTAVGFLGRYR